MTNDTTFKKIGLVVSSNVIKLISNILMGFLIPNILGVSNYGYYKIFALYLGYTGILHFGFIDGIYLKFGGTDYQNLDKYRFRTFFQFFIILETMVSMIGIVLSSLLLQGETKLIFVLLFCNVLAVNTITYYQFISQITARFKEYSFRTILMSLVNILIVLMVLLLDITDYKIYIILIIFSNYLLSIWYISTYRNITFGKQRRILDDFNGIAAMFKMGFPLLFANFVIIFLLSLDKQIIEIFFTVEEFGIYSFAYSMLAMITVVVSAIGVVLYPILKKANTSNLTKNYSNLSIIMTIIVLVGLLGYFPLQIIVPLFLPDYGASLIVFRIALPGLVLISSIQAIKHNYYKIAGKNMAFVIIGIITIAVNLVLNLISYYIYRKTAAVAVSSVIGMTIWYLIVELYMVKKYKIEWKENFILALFGMIIFYIVTIIDNFYVSMSLYSLFIVIILILYKNKIIY